jgi:hypothetical protein
MNIRTNHKPRPLLYGSELPAKWKEHFDYLSDEEYLTGNFVKYKGWVYDANDFMRCEGSLAILGFDGYLPDTYFSGVLIRFLPDSESVVMATYYS